MLQSAYLNQGTAFQEPGSTARRIGPSERWQRGPRQPSAVTRRSAASPPGRLGVQRALKPRLPAVSTRGTGSPLAWVASFVAQGLVSFSGGRRGAGRGWFRLPARSSPEAARRARRAPGQRSSRGGRGREPMGAARPCDRRGGCCPRRAAGVGSRRSPAPGGSPFAVAGLTHVSITFSSGSQRGRRAERGAPRQTKQRWQGSSHGSGTSGSGCRTT